MVHTIAKHIAALATDSKLHLTRVYLLAETPPSYLNTTLTALNHVYKTSASASTVAASQVVDCICMDALSSVLWQNSGPVQLALV